MSKKDNNNIVENEQSVQAKTEEVIDRVSSVKEATEEEHMALDDARRVKVLSPSMLVFKRFIRNKLAITGSIILILMFLFSFVGGWISPYTQSQVFNTTTVRSKPYALGSETNNLRFVNAEGEALGGDNAAVLYAIKEMRTYTDGRYTNPLGTVYKVDFHNDDYVDVYRMVNVATVNTVGMNNTSVTINDDGVKYFNLGKADENALIAGAAGVSKDGDITLNSGKANCLFNCKDAEMLAVKESKTQTNIFAPVLVAMSSTNHYDAVTPSEQETINSFAFQSAFETALVNNESSFTVDGVTYEINKDSMAIVTQEITDKNDPNYDPNFSNTIEESGLQQAISDLILNSDDHETKTLTVDGKEYTLEWVEYEVGAYTGRAGNAEMDAIVAAPGFKEAAYECYLANEEELQVKQVGGTYPKFPFSANGADYTLEYSEEAGHYIIKEAGKEVYYAKLVFVNAYDVTFVNEEGEKVVYAQASEWEASSIKKDGKDYAYVSNFKVIPDASRGGLVLDLDFMNKVRKACAAMPTAAQTGATFNHKIWVVDELEPMLSEGDIVRDDDNNAEAIPDEVYGIIEFLGKYYVITDDGQITEVMTKVARSPIEQDGLYGKSFLEEDTNNPIYKNWPVIMTDVDGAYYEDADGNAVHLESEMSYEPVVEEDADGAKFYKGADGQTYPEADVDVQQSEDGSSFFFINEEGEQVDLEAEPVYTAIEGKDGTGAFYTTDSGEKVYASTLTATEKLNENGEFEGYVVTDAFGNEHNIQFNAEVLVDRQSDDGGEYVTGVDGKKIYTADTGLHTEEGDDDGSVDDDKMYVWVLNTDDSSADDLKTEKVYIKTSKSQNIAAEGDEGAYLKDMEFQVQYGNIQYTVMTNTEVDVFDSHGAPSKAHWLGTDNHGMDTLTRIMYGGRISLMVGFVVIFIEMLIGVIFGGISGYFGGVVDTIMMRFVDLFNCIPYWPMMLIGGSLMDAYSVRGTIRIFVLVGIMGILGWTGTARIVRGQILSLREQDFMVATEAGGIRVSRRIFKHLVPNVMPLLIVQATMGLGSIIISEATLSFLGLGVQFPQASWGSIINSIQTAYEMTNYWYVWIPTGLCIMLAVLGFNFVGDGLRDAFDPKMKR